MRVPPLAAALLLLAARAAAEPSARTVEVWGEAVVGAEMTERQTRRAAVDDARAKALEVACGIEVRSAGLYVTGLERAHYLQSLAAGYVVGEEVLEWRADLLQERPAAPPILRYRVRVRATVAHLSGQAAAHLTRAELNRGSFQAGEHAELSLATDRTAWVYVFHLSEDDQATLLLPNPGQRTNRIEPGGSLRFPSRESGTALEVLNERGEEETREAFLVLAFGDRVPLEEHLRPGQAYPLSELYRRLLQCSAEGAHARILPYSVRSASRPARSASAGIPTE